MKNVLLFSCGLLSLLLAGCESFGERVTEKFRPVPPRAETFAVDEKGAYAAARTALTELAFTITGSSAARGKIEAAGPIGAGDTIKGSRQITASISIVPLIDGGTSVEISLLEVIQDDFDRGASMGTQTPLRDTPLYDVFFRKMRQSLGEPEPAVAQPPAG